MRPMGRILAITCVAVLVSVGSWAQLSKGFKGKVLDRDGKPVPDCPVVLEDLGNPQNHYETKTAANGSYLYSGIPFSDKGYTIKVKLPNHPELPEVAKVDKPKMLEFTEVDFDMRKDLVMKGGEATPSPAAEAKKLYDMNDYEGALAKAQEAMSDKDVNTLKVAGLIKASCLQNLGRADDAIAAYEAFNTSYPGNADVLGNLAKLYNQKGDKAKAEKLTRRSSRPRAARCWAKPTTRGWRPSTPAMRSRRPSSSSRPSKRTQTTRTPRRTGRWPSPSSTSPRRRSRTCRPTSN